MPYPLVMGLLVAAAFISLTALVLRALGMGRGSALYLAALLFAVGMYFVSRRILRRRG